MDRHEAIERLRIDSEYYGAFGKQWFSASTIKKILENPRTFHTEMPPVKELLEGNYFHKLILEPQKASEIHIVNASTRNTNLYKDYLVANGIDIALLKSEADNIRAMADACNLNSKFKETVFHVGNRYEEPIIGDVYGYPFKGKADALGETVVIDIKSTSDIGKFKWDAKKYGYDIQAYIYRELFGKEMVFIAVDKSSYTIGFFEATEDFYESGSRKVAEALDLYDKYIGPSAIESIDEFCIVDFL